MAVLQGNAKQGSTRGFYPKNINGSLRFNDDDSAYLFGGINTTISTYTISYWFKRSTITSSEYQYMFSTRSNGGIAIASTGGQVDEIYVYNQGGGDVQYLGSGRKFRDPSAWYHLVMKVSSGAATVYINGEQLGTATAGSVDSNASIGRYGSGGYYFDGYLAEVHFTDGTAYDADAFGEFKNGVWVAKTPEVTYGTNGFYLDFQDDTEVEAFNTVLYRGTGSEQSITGMGFQPDLLWIKNRSEAFSHGLIDSVRGATKVLESDDTGAEYTNTGSVLSFDADGFTSGASDLFGKSGNSYVAWGWKAGDSNVSNTDGSITSTVRANDTYGFSIVSYEGTGANATVGHGLSTAPDFVITKNRDVATDWQVYHSDVITADNQQIELNKTGGIGTVGTVCWDVSEFNSDTIGLGANNTTNGSGNDMIAYCWAEKSGYSKFGSYTGNGSSQTISGLGFNPAWILIKCTSASGENWLIFDNTRSVDNPKEKVLLPNSSAAEGTPSNYIDFNADGSFDINVSAGSINGSGRTYIYAAFADTREAAFWLDQSGNDNDWQPVNLDHNDTVADSPTNNFATLNPLCPSATNVYADGNLRLHMTNKSNGSSNSFNLPTIQPLNTGKIYYEFVTGVQAGGGNAVATGVIGADKKYYDILFAGNSDVSGFYLYNGSVDAQNAGSGTAGVASYSNGDTIGIAIDFDNQKMYCFVNGSEVTGQSISSGTAVVTFPTTGDHHFFLTCGSNTGGSNTSNLTVNFGQQPFKYDPPE